MRGEDCWGEPLRVVFIPFRKADKKSEIKFVTFFVFARAMGEGKNLYSLMDLRLYLLIGCLARTTNVGS